MFRAIVLLAVAGLAGCEADDLTRIHVDGEDLYVMGTFDHQTKPRVLDALEANPEIRTIVLTANGGSIDDECTLALGREIRERGLRTHVVADGVIASGGLSLFLAGAQRSIGPGARVGVHSWQRCWNEQPEGTKQCKDAQDHPADDPQHELHGSYTEEMLGDRGLYWFSIQAAPSDSIHWMTEVELATHAIANAAPAAIRKQPFGAEFAAERQRICSSCEPLD